MKFDINICKQCHNFLDDDLGLWCTYRDAETNGKLIYAYIGFKRSDGSIDYMNQAVDGIPPNCPFTLEYILLERSVQ